MKGIQINKLEVFPWQNLLNVPNVVLRRLNPATKHPEWIACETIKNNIY